jgi:predicted O-linked N-acetylglucosamine transferase (SPINDLY family)
MPTEPHSAVLSEIIPFHSGLDGPGFAPSDLDALRSALAAHLANPEEPEARVHLLQVRRATAQAISRWPRQHRQGTEIHGAFELVREMAKTGVHDHPVEADDLRLADDLARRDWRGVLAAMLLVPAWQWPAAPLLAEVTDWLRPDYVRWLFVAPKNFTAPGHAGEYAAFHLKRLEELLRWLNRGVDATEQRKVLAVYASHCSLRTAALADGNLVRQAELRGRLLARTMGKMDDHYRAPVKPGAGRRLRIGIIHRHFESRAEIHAALPLFGRLDPERFEVRLYTYVNDFSSMEELCRQHVADFVLLPADLKEQLGLLRKDALDVALFCSDLAGDCNVVTRLALHRVAALQVVNDATGHSAGLPEIDLHVTGALAVKPGVAAAFGERLGLLPGASHAFVRDAEQPQLGCMRADYGLPEGVPVFVSTADYWKITPEVRQAWAQLLAVVPGSYLLVHPFAAGPVPVPVMTYFHAELTAALQGAGVHPARGVVSSVVFPTRADVQGLVALGDVYLDTFTGSAVETLADPLELGLPVVTREGESLRSCTGASLLRATGLAELVADSAESYQAIAARLAVDPVYRQDCRQRLRPPAGQDPAWSDMKGVSAAFGELMLAAHAELLVRGRTAFRADPTPLKA